MKRRHILQTAAGAAMLNLFPTGETMAAQNTYAQASEADDILNRLMNKDIPAAVDLDARMRTLISIASLTAMGEVRVLRKVVADGIQSGVNPVENRIGVTDSSPSAPSTPPTVRIRSGRLPITSSGRHL